MQFLALCVMLTLDARPEPLFPDGIDDWKVVGTASYTWEDPVLRGEGQERRNTFLVSPVPYGDFILETDVRIAEGGNSGIQIRSEVVGQAVRGYQIEIDSSPRAWSGGLYDELRRGWLAPLEHDEKARQAFRNGAWNRYRIECEGPRIRTWVNDIPCVDAIDPMNAKGIIAFQVHSGGPTHVEWREPKLDVLGEHTWTPVDRAQVDGATAAYGDGTCVRARVRGAVTATIDDGGEFHVDFHRTPTSGPGSIRRLHDVVAAVTDDEQDRWKEGEWNDVALCWWDGRLVVHVNNRQVAEARIASPTGRIAFTAHEGSVQDAVERVEVLRRAAD